MAIQFFFSKNSFMKQNLQYQDQFVPPPQVIHTKMISPRGVPLNVWNICGGDGAMGVEVANGTICEESFLSQC